MFRSLHTFNFFQKEISINAIVFTVKKDDGSAVQINFDRRKVQMVVMHKILLVSSTLQFAFPLYFVNHQLSRFSEHILPLMPMEKLRSS